MNGSSATEHGVPTLEQFAGAVVGGVLVGYAQRRAGARRAVANAIGLGMIATALTRTVVAVVRTAGQRRRTIRLHRTFHLAEPVRDVFAFCKNFENFPRIIGSLRAVIDHEDGRSHWEVSSPSGHVLEWDAVVTKYVPNVVIAWRSVAGSPVESSGTVRFTPAEGGTNVDLQITYVPNETSLGDALLAIVDTPRQEQIEHDIERADAYLAAPSATTADTAGGSRDVAHAPATDEHSERMPA